MSQRDVPDWFSFYVYEFMSDERVVAMTLEQVGAYVLLMLGQWINGSIPSDIPALARLLKRTTAEMEILWAGVGPCFTPHPTEGGRLIQARLEEERGVTIQRMEKARTKEKTRREKERLKREQEARGGVVLETCQTPVGNVPEPCTVLSSYVLSTSSKKENVEKNIKQWEEFKALYPQHRFDEARAGFAWAAADDSDAILGGLKAWLPSDSWKDAGGKFVNAASRFISEGVYKMRPQAEAEPAPSRYREWDGKS